MRIDHDTLVCSVLYSHVSGKKMILLYRHSYFFSDLTQLPQHFWPLSQEPINLFLYRPNAGSYHQGAPVSTAWCNSAGGVRKPYGGIRWLGLKRGTVVQHAAHGLCTVRRKEERRGGPSPESRRASTPRPLNGQQTMGYNSSSQIPVRKRRGLCLCSTAILSTPADGQLWLRGTTHQGALTMCLSVPTVAEPLAGTERD